MIFKFLLVSDEVEDFRREIKIDGDNTFFDLHKVIMKCSGYDKTEMTSFFMSDDWWKKKQEISLVELDTDSDVDSYVMKEEVLSDWLDEEKQRLIFVFDYSADRGFYMELSEMIPGQNLSTAVCSKKQGEAPVQFLVEEEEAPVIPVTITPDLLIEDDEPLIEDDEKFYGEDDYNPDELDVEGFEGLDDPDSEIDTDLDISEDTELF